MKYIILENDYKPTLVNQILEGFTPSKESEYIGITLNNQTLYFLKEYVKEYKEPKTKTNKTAIINSINVYGDSRKIQEVKEIIHIKNMLKKYSVKDDMEYIEYKYNRLIELYYLSGMSIITWEIEYILKDTIKFILASNININNGYELEKIKQWIENKL